MAGSRPRPGKPMELISAFSLGSLITRGFGFPGLEDRVIVPPVTKPKPRFNKDVRTLQSLSKPAAIPIGVGKARPDTWVFNFSFLVPFVKRNAFHNRGIDRVNSATLWAPSGGRVNMSGFAVRLYMFVVLLH